MGRVLAVIPAKAGSKEVKNKNIVRVSGRPLMWYTIMPALRALEEGLVDSVALSTDSPKIADMARGFGVSVPFIRPKKLAKDNTTSAEVVLHAVEFFAARKEYFEAIMLLQPTSPLRSYEDMRESIRLFFSKRTNSLVSVYRDEKVQTGIIYKKTNGNVGAPLDRFHNCGIRRQKSCEVYIRNGAIYITSMSYLRRSSKLISGRPILYEMPRERSLNIDTVKDLKELKRIFAGGRHSQS